MLFMCRESFLQKIKKKRIVVVSLTLLVVGCAAIVMLMHNKVVPSFYYWKSTFHLSKLEQNLLKEQKIGQLYIRLFDVGWDNVSNTPVPLGKFTFTERSAFQGEIVPVVYITNRVFARIGAAEVDSLATRIYSQVSVMAKRADFSFNVLQIDCDWTEKTRSKYFRFLEGLSKIASGRGAVVSATIRLHQV